MTRESTINKLRRYHEKATGLLPCWADPKWHHPLPQLPPQNYLEEEYLEEIRRSNPCLLEEATRLVEEIETLRETNPVEEEYIQEIRRITGPELLESNPHLLEKAIRLLENRVGILPKERKSSYRGKLIERR